MSDYAQMRLAKQNPSMLDGNSEQDVKEELQKKGLYGRQGVDDFGETITRSLTTTLRGKIIFFDGQYREKEIDMQFEINPGLDPFQHVNISTYLVKTNGTQIYFDEQAYFDVQNMTTDEFNEKYGITPGDKTLRQLKVSDVLLTVQIKEQFALRKEMKGRANITLDDCMINAKTTEATCLSMVINSDQRSFKSAQFPTQLKLEVQGRSLDKYLEVLSDYSYYCSIFLIYASFVLM